MARQVKNYSLDAATVSKIERLAEQTRRSMSAIIEIAVLALPESTKEFERVAIAANTEEAA